MGIYGLVYGEYLSNMWFVFGDWVNRDLRCNNSSS